MIDQTDPYSSYYYSYGKLHLGFYSRPFPCLDTRYNLQVINSHFYPFGIGDVIATEHECTRRGARSLSHLWSDNWTLHKLETYALLKSDCHH